jgi:hypothetical protein
MQGFPFNLPLEQHSVVLPIDTDTATPRFPIPIYFIHSFEQPLLNLYTILCNVKLSTQSHENSLGL